MWQDLFVKQSSCPKKCLKWFDKLTTLSPVEGQIPMIHPPLADQTKNQPTCPVASSHD
jgi:hypothetical protein